MRVAAQGTSLKESSSTEQKAGMALIEPNVELPACEKADSNDSLVEEGARFDVINAFFKKVPFSSYFCICMYSASILLQTWFFLTKISLIN